jgi:hypothetical protein
LIKKIALALMCYFLFMGTVHKGVLMKGAVYLEGSCGTDYSSDSNLQLWYRMEEDGASNRVDGSANGNDLTAAGTVVKDTTTYKEGTGSNYSDGGATDRLSIADASITGSVCGKVTCANATFGGWVNYDVVPAADSYAAEKGSWRFNHYTSTSDFSCTMNAGAGNIFVSADANTVADTWYFVVCILDDTADEFRMRKDGVDQADVETVTGSIATDTVALTFFEAEDGTLDMTGWIDDWFMFNRLLSDAEIDEIESCGVDGSGLP